MAGAEAVRVPWRAAAVLGRVASLILIIVVVVLPGVAAAGLPVSVLKLVRTAVAIAVAVVVIVRMAPLALVLAKLAEPIPFIGAMLVSVMLVSVMRATAGEDRDTARRPGEKV